MQSTILNIKCRICNETKSVTVSKEGLAKWRQGELIQRALPFTSPGERELIKTQICEPCFDKMFGE